jgi:hypothetical protein
VSSTQIGLKSLLPNYPFLYLRHNPVYNQKIAVFRYSGKKKKIHNPPRTIWGGLG